jgi:hypothetical protein
VFRLEPKTDGGVDGHSLGQFHTGAPLT